MPQREQSENNGLKMNNYLKFKLQWILLYYHFIPSSLWTCDAISIHLTRSTNLKYLFCWGTRIRTLNQRTKIFCVTITPYIGTYKPMQQDSNPHLSFYLKKNCRKIAVSFPIFRTFYLSPPQVLKLEN